MVHDSLLYPRNTASRQAVSLNGMWRFQLDYDSRGILDKWSDALPAPDWIPVPASFADFFTDKETREFCGDFWYETEVVIPKDWMGKEVNIRFGSVTHRATVYLNGVEVASHEGGFLPFNARITDVARYGQVNRLVVMGNNELSETTIPCGITSTLPNGRKLAKPYFDFYNYAGIHRNVWLTATPSEYISDYSVNYELQGADALVHYSVDTTGENAVKVTLSDEAGCVVAEGNGKKGTLTVANAHLWQVRNAYLYKLTIQIIDGLAVTDEYSENIGIRTVAVSGKDILINGKPVYLKGFGKHEDSDIVGRGYNPGAWKRDFELMKWIGANSFRTSHYPYAEEVYQMADREGFLVIDEVPAVGMFPSLMNFAEASSGKQTGFFAKKSIPELYDCHAAQVREMIQRDKNHPCVFAWSLLNEPETTDEHATPYFEKIFAYAHEIDPQKRPRTFAIIMNSLPHNCKCWQVSDFCSLNRYYGWYAQGGPDIGAAEEGLRKELAQWRELTGGEKPFIFTEYGADTSAMVDKLPSVMWSEQYQIEYLQMNHKVFDEFDFVRGEQVWNFADFQTTEGIMRMDGNKKGIFTRQRQPKRAAFYFKDRWEKLPLDYKTEETQSE